MTAANEVPDRRLARTTGAISGQLAGAYWGESKIAQSLRDGLARVDLLEDAIAGLSA